MNTRAKIIRLFSLTVIGFCAQPLLVSASAQAPKFAIDSVNKHVKSHPKPKKTTASPVAAAKASAPAKGAKANRDVPQLIQPVGQPAAAQTAKRAAPTAAADSVPAVRRAAAAPRKKSSR